MQRMFPDNPSTENTEIVTPTIQNSKLISDIIITDNTNVLMYQPTQHVLGQSLHFFLLSFSSNISCNERQRQQRTWNCLSHIYLSTSLYISYYSQSSCLVFNFHFRRITQIFWVKFEEPVNSWNQLGLVILSSQSILQYTLNYAK